MTIIDKLKYYSQWCSDIYHNQTNATVLEHYCNNGFYSWVVLNHNYEIVVVMRGTDNMADVVQDIEMVIGVLPTHFSYACITFAQAAKYAQQLNLPVVASGHSLGGSLAQYLSYKYNINSYTFNPYGIIKLIDSNSLTNETMNKVQNYCVDNDVVSSCSLAWQVGKIVTWNVPSSLYPSTMNIIERTIFLHSIDTCVKLVQAMTE